MTTTELLHPLRRAPASAAPTASARRSSVNSSTQRDTDRVVEPRWARPALLVLLLLTAAAYMWDLSASGYANSFYAAAVQAGTKSWKAFFFGSLDSSNFITVDKPPASLWVMALSGRIFGFSSCEHARPAGARGRRRGRAAVRGGQALVRSRRRARWPGAVFALTPVAALMFRFNNPDALLVLLLVASAYCLMRALERAGTRWILAAGATDRLRVPGEDDAGLPGAAGVRAGVPGRGADDAAAADRPAAGRRRRDAAQRRLVGGDRRALAGRLATVHRRLARQQHPQPDLRLQRPRADLRQRRRSRRGRGSRRGRRRQLQRPDRPVAAVQRADGRPGLVAAARRAARARRRPVGRAAARRAPTARARRCCCGAAGCSSRRSSSASGRA